MANIRDSLSHTKWMCKYQIEFTPKYRRKAIYGQYKESIGQILRQLCNYKGVEIVEGHLMPDHVHMLVSTGGTKVLEDEGKYNLETPTEEIQYFIYTPTEDEWANLKAQGMAIQGYAVKLIKLELVDNN